jgi:hypothetical protein
MMHRLLDLFQSCSFLSVLQMLVMLLQLASEVGEPLNIELQQSVRA